MAGRVAEEVVSTPFGGHVSVAPGGSTPPTDLSSLSGDFIDVGWVSVDSVGFNVGLEKNMILAWGSQGRPVRQNVTGRPVQVRFVPKQWNADNFVLAFGGGETDEDTGVYTYHPPASGEDPAEWVVVFDFEDGSYDYRLVFVRGSLAEAVDVSLVETDAANLPLVFDLLANDSGDDWYAMTDNPAFAPAESS